MYLDFIKKNWFFIILVFVGLMYFVFDPLKHADKNNPLSKNGLLSLTGKYKQDNQPSAVSDLSSNAQLASAAKGAGANQPEIPTVIEEGKHYQVIDAAIMTKPEIQRFLMQDPGKIQVVEFFNYGCYWCQQLHPHIVAWAEKKPASVAFYQIPVVFHKGWDVLARTYFVVKTLGKNKELDQEIFTAVHQKNVNLGDEATLKKYFVEKGIPEKDFWTIYQSFSTNQSFNESKTLYDAYKLTTSPIVVINGPTGGYMSTAPMAGSEKGLLKVMDYLIAKEESKLAVKPAVDLQEAPVVSDMASPAAAPAVSELSAPEPIIPDSAAQ